MGLVTVDNDEVYAISVSQSPGMMAPAINARILPHQADVTDAANLSYVAPDLSIDIGGVTYTCAADEVSLEIEPESVGMDVEVQYYPKVLRTLRHGGLKKSLVFISCRPYQRALLEDEYDTDRFEVLFKECDVYVSNGWTLAEIFQEIGTRAGVTLQCLLPPFHMPNTTVILQRGQNFLDFLRGLLPQGFEYSWALYDDVLSVSLVQSGHEGSLSFVPGMFRIAVASQALPAYDFVEITGGEYKYGQTFDMGDAEWGVSVSYPDGQLLTKTLPQETHETDEGTETVDVSIQYRTGPDGQEMFALLERTTIVNGPYPNTFGVILTTKIRETLEEYTYENSDPSIYRTPRKTQVDTTVSQYYTKVAGASLSGAQVFLLTDDLRVLSSEEYAALGVGAPAVMLAAYQVYGEAETSTETWEYITESTADWNWHEGMQKSNVLSVSHKFCLVNDLYYDAHLSPKELLQAVLTDMTTQGEDTVSSYSSDIDKEGSVVMRTISFLNTDSYQYEETTKLFDTKAGGMMSQPTVRQILDTGRVPSSPSNYRTAPMKLTLNTLNDSAESRSWYNGLGGNDVCFSKFAQVLTNNPTDFKAWAGALMEQLLYVPRNVSMVSIDRLFRVGSIVGGVTITSFQVSESEGEQSVVLGGIA